MEKIIKDNIEGTFLFTNHCVNNITSNDSIKHNQEAKALLEHIEVYKIIINNLIKNDNGKSMK